jgi:predicted aldo/keto reductase-like oxidoreductase
LEVVTAQYNFASIATWGPAIEKLQKAGVGLVAMKVMAGGVRGRNPKPQMQRPNAAAAAIKWVINNPAIATTIPSMTDIEQLQTNFAVMGQKFTDDDAKILAARLEEIRPFYCRACGQCDGQCPKGLPVPYMVRYAMYADGYGQFALGRERFLTMSEKHQAVRCEDCSTCAVRCPNGVHVAERLIRAQELFA